MWSDKHPEASGQACTIEVGTRDKWNKTVLGWTSRSRALGSTKQKTLYV